jgi:hypothetical protein
MEPTEVQLFVSKIQIQLLDGPRFGSRKSFTSCECSVHSGASGNRPCANALRDGHKCACVMHVCECIVQHIVVALRILCSSHTLKILFPV